jgi:hypothetical protein
MVPKISRRKFILSAITSVVSAGVVGCGVHPPDPPMQRLTPTVKPSDSSSELIRLTPTPVPNVEPAVKIVTENVSLALEDPNIAAIVNILREKINYLYLSEADLVAFAQDFKSKAGQKLLELLENNSEQLEYEATTQFLMSTDFFWNGADETRPVKYLVYYDPYKGCTSPFARFD